jgi:hypothetical protein
MSIDEVMTIAAEYRIAPTFAGRCEAKIALRTAIEQHVAEEVARETERCVKACGTQIVQLDRLPNQTEFIRNVTVGRCIEAIRARGTK